MTDLLEQANLVVREADKLRDTIREMAKGDPKPAGWRKLWHHDTCGLTEDDIRIGRRDTEKGHRWTRYLIGDGYVIHKGVKGKPIQPIGHPLPEVDIEGAKAVRWTLNKRIIHSMAVAGKDVACSLNGGYRGSGGWTTHGWKRSGFTANVMHPIVKDSVGVRHFVAYGGMKPKPGNGKFYGDNVNYHGEPLQDRKWYEIVTELDLVTNKLKLIINGKLINESKSLSPLMWHRPQEPKKAHIFLRHMAGGVPEHEKNIPKRDWEEHWGAVSIEAKF